MKSTVGISIDTIAEKVADDETGELMAQLLAGAIREFSGCPQEFGQWMQDAMNDARYLIPEKDAETWADDFILRVEQAALKLY